MGIYIYIYDMIEYILHKMCSIYLEFNLNPLNFTLIMLIQVYFIYLHSIKLNVLCYCRVKMKLVKALMLKL